MNSNPGASWANEEGKRELFASSGGSEVGASAADLIAQDIAELADADLLAQALSASGAFGLRPGLSRTEVSALGLPASDDHHNVQSDDSEDGQTLEYQFDEGTLCDVEYTLHRRGGDWLDAAQELAVEHLRGVFGDDARRHTYQFLTAAGRWKISQEVRNIQGAPFTVGYLTVRLERA